jgi:predicted CXXCH cytochrome family protein
MKKNLMFVLLLPALLTALVLPALSQEDMTSIDAEGFQKRQRPAAVFKHDEHNATAEIEACNECHHVYENGAKLDDESSEDRPCSECHREYSATNQPGLKKAFHLNCRGCHLEKKKGPVMCGQCHVR